MDEQIIEMCNSLAETSCILQAETSAQKIILIALLSAIAEDPALLEKVKQKLSIAYEGVQATNLNLPVPDEQLQRQQDALIGMLPAPFLPCLGQRQ